MIGVYFVVRKKGWWGGILGVWGLFVVMRFVYEKLIWVFVVVVEKR